MDINNTRINVTLLLDTHQPEFLRSTLVGSAWGAIADLMQPLGNLGRFKQISAHIQSISGYSCPSAQLASFNLGLSDWGLGDWGLGNRGSDSFGLGAIAGMLASDGFYRQSCSQPTEDIAKAITKDIIEGIHSPSFHTLEDKLNLYLRSGKRRQAIPI